MIPMPNYNAEETIKYVEVLMQAIIDKEVEIKKKHESILGNIQKELEINQTDKSFVYSLPTINEILDLDRMDSSLYSVEFKEKEYKSYILIDFNKVSKKIREAFDDLNNFDIFFQTLMLEYGKRLYVRDSLIIFDEIQKYPKARQAI